MLGNQGAEPRKALRLSQLHEERCDNIKKERSAQALFYMNPPQNVKVLLQKLEHERTIRLVPVWGRGVDPGSHFYGDLLLMEAPPTLFTSVLPSTDSTLPAGLGPLSFWAQLANMDV